MSAKSVAERVARAPRRTSIPTREEQLPTTVRGTAPLGARPATSSRACTSRASTTSWCGCRAAAPRCPATRSWASSPGAAACRCTGPTAPTPCRSPIGQADRLIDVEWDTDIAGTFVASIEVKALDRARLLRDVIAVLADHHVNIVALQHPHRLRPHLEDAVRLRARRPVAPRLASSAASSRSTASTTPTGCSPARARCPSTGSKRVITPPARARPSTSDNRAAAGVRCVTGIRGRRIISGAG